MLKRERASLAVPPSLAPGSLPPSLRNQRRGGPPHLGGTIFTRQKGENDQKESGDAFTDSQKGLLLLLLRRFFPEILQSYDIVSGKVFVEFQASFLRLRDTGNSVHIHTDYRKRAWNKKEICIPDLTPSSHNKSEHGQIKYSKSGATNFLSAETGVGSWKHVFASLFPMQKRRKDH